MAEGSADREERRSARVDPAHPETTLFQELLQAQNEMGIGVAITEGSRFILVNEALAKMYGYTVAEMLALPSTLDAIAPESRAEVRTPRRRVADEEATTRRRKPQLRKMAPAPCRIRLEGPARSSPDLA
jgi:PAS domain-containing protein